MPSSSGWLLYCRPSVARSCMYVTSLGLLAWFCLLVKLGGFTCSVPHVMRSCLIGPVWLCSISSMIHSARQISSQTGVNSPHLSNAALQGKALAEKLPDALAHVVMHDATGHEMGYMHQECMSHPTLQATQTFTRTQQQNLTSLPQHCYTRFCCCSTL